MKIYILTDLEGPAGVSQWDQTRVDESPKKTAAMELLTREINACVDGILDYDPKAEVVVWDGHGSGGILYPLIHSKAELILGKGIDRRYGLDDTFDALFFVGQHAMAGTENAPLCHTYSSQTVEYYKLNGDPIGEFGCRAYLAGMFDVPVTFLAGDDKACAEAEALVPGIVTAATKTGMGIEIARHLSPKRARKQIRRGAREACKRAKTVPPLKLDPPYEFEIRVYEGKSVEGHIRRGAVQLDERTCVYKTDDLLSLPI